MIYYYDGSSMIAGVVIALIAFLFGFWLGPEIKRLEKGDDKNVLEQNRKKK